ncbi:MAG TPA: IS110 family transposase [Lacunisphaera sp.]|nr:IS110 family transposase [Lacunisphaera sp.]
MHTIICGLDVASTSARAALLDGQGAIVQELDLPATRAGEDQLLGLLPPASVVIMESTGRYHLRWARRLAAAGYEVYVLNALLAKRLATSTNALREYKSDPLDARHLAQIGRLHPETIRTYRFHENPARQRLRELCQVRTTQRRILTEVLAVAHHYLGLLLPEAESLDLHFAQHKGAVRLFLSVDSLERMRGLRLGTVQKHLGEKAAPFHAVLHTPLNAAALFDAYLPALHAQLRLVEALQELLAQLALDIRQAARDSGRWQQIQLAQSLPGFGEKSTPAIIACLPDGWEQWGDKRTTANKLQAYFGCDPRVRTSGKWEGRVKMTKRGNELARTALFQAAFCALRVDSGLHATYQKQIAAGKHHKVAISHVMRRQLRRLVAVLKAGSPFVPDQSLAHAA